MKYSYIALIGLMAIAQTARADFSYNTTTMATNGWSSGPKGPGSWGVSYEGFQNNYMEISIGNGEYDSSHPDESIVHSVNPVYAMPGSTWTVSETIDEGTTPNNVPASKELQAFTGANSGLYIIAFMAGVSSHSVNYTPQNGYMIGIYNDMDGTWAYVTSSELNYRGETTFSISYAGSGTVNYYVGNGIVGIANSQLIYTQTGMDAADPNISDLETLGLGSYNFDAGGNNSFIGDVSAATFAPVPEPSPVSLLACAGIGLAGIAGWRRWNSQNHLEPD